MNFYLKPELLNDLREAVNACSALRADSRNYHMICAIMDRMQRATRYLNNKNDYPQSDEEYLLFMVNACMIKHAIDSLSKYLKNQNVVPESAKSCLFREVCITPPLSIEDRLVPSDDKFWEYLRSLSFAHPFETDRQTFLKEDKNTHFSPYIILYNNINSYCCKINNICIKVYVNDGSDFELNIPWQDILAYVQICYDRLEYYLTWIKNNLEHTYAEWKSHKIDRSKDCHSILIQLANELRARNDDQVYLIDQMLNDYTCKISNESNSESVQKYRTAITEILPTICDTVEEIGDLNSILNHRLFVLPRHCYSDCSYDIAKIENMIDGGFVSVKIGKECAKEFAKEFGYKWVCIEPYQMEVSEIIMLTHVACYLEVHNVSKDS